MTRMAFIGNFQPGQIEPLPWSTESHYARSFEKLGVAVLPVQENDPAGALDVVRAHHAEYPIDVLMYVRTWGLDMARSWRLFRDLEADGVKTAAVHLDTWNGLDREAEVVTQSMFRVADFFTVDGDAALLWDRAGVRWHHLHAGVVEDEAFDAEPFGRGECPWDVAFVGSRGYHQEWPHRPELVDWLRARYGERFVHVGDGDLPTMRGVERLNRFYRSVPVVVGDSLGANRESLYWSDRFYETYGRGGTLVFPRIRALVEEVGPYPAWDVGDWDELARVVDDLLENPTKRETWRREIAGTVRARCTYTQRAETILTTLGLR